MHFGAHLRILSIYPRKLLLQTVEQVSFTLHWINSEMLNICPLCQWLFFWSLSLISNISVSCTKKLETSVFRKFKCLSKKVTD